MANYLTSRYNGLIDDSENILEYLTGATLHPYENRTLNCGTEFMALEHMKFVEIKGYRKLNLPDFTLSKIKQAVEEALEVCYSHNCGFAFFIVSDGISVRFLYSYETTGQTGIEQGIKNYIPNVLAETSSISKDIQRACSRYGGIICGEYDIAGAIGDSIAAALLGKRAICSVLCIPQGSDDYRRFKRGLANLHIQTETLLSDNFTYPSQGRKTRKKVFPGVEKLNTFLETLMADTEKRTSHSWDTCIWFSGESRETAQSVGNALCGIINSNTQLTHSKARCFFTTENPFTTGILGIPLASYGGVPEMLPEDLEKPSLITRSYSDQIASLLQLPMNSFPGFEVYDAAVDENSLRAFPSFGPHTGVNSIRLGREDNTNAQYYMELNDITEHVLITGSTGSGKTNTVMTLVNRICCAHIPVCIIEPSKKEYWQLIESIPDLQIYSAGQDAFPLKINPLEPEEGVAIANHIDSILYAFTGAFDMEEPTRLALDGLIKYTYQRLGWRLNEIAYPQGKRYPYISDLLADLKDFCRDRLPYGDEVRSNIEGALTNRLSALSTGVIGDILNVGQGINGRDICLGNVLIELDDLSLDTKPFVATILLIKADQFLRQRNSTSTIRNVLVLEEAHNIFARVSNRGNESPKEKASNFFSNMLSQIRGFGTGIIIADQGASQIHETAVANTKVKITHAISQSADAEAVAYAAHLSDYQRGLLPALPTGDAIVSIRGNRSVCQVHVDQAPRKPIKNYACILCGRRQMCRYDYVKSTVDRQPLLKVTCGQHLYSHRYDASALAEDLDVIASQFQIQPEYKFCLAGYLLSDDSLLCNERQRRRIAHLCYMRKEYL